MANKTEINTQLLGITKEELPEIDLSNFQVVRREFFSHIKEAIMTIRPNKISFNNSCIAKMPGVTHVFIGVDINAGTLIIRAADELDKDAQRWCNVKEEKRVSREITGKKFADMLYRDMGWSKRYYYKFCGTPALRKDADDELIFVFNLNDKQIFPMTEKSRIAAGVTDETLDIERALHPEWMEKQGRYDGIDGSYGDMMNEHKPQAELKRLDGFETFKK